MLWQLHLVAPTVYVDGEGGVQRDRKRERERASENDLFPK